LHRVVCPGRHFQATAFDPESLRHGRQNTVTELLSILSVLWDRDGCRTMDARYPCLVRCSQSENTEKIEVKP
jgi:hypothetical protein